MHIIQFIDESILLWIQNSIRFDFINPIIEFYTALGNKGIMWIVLSVIMICYKPTRKFGILSAIALVYSLIFTNFIIKPLVARPRPYVTMEELIPLVISHDVNSFPSGHTSAAFAAGIVWAKTMPNCFLKTISIVQAVFMGLSRIYVGVHYPSDVVGGLFVGVICAYLAFITAKYLERKDIYDFTN